MVVVIGAGVVVELLLPLVLFVAQLTVQTGTRLNLAFSSSGPYGPSEDPLDTPQLSVPQVCGADHHVVTRHEECGVHRVKHSASSEKKSERLDRKWDRVKRDKSQRLWKELLRLRGFLQASVQTRVSLLLYQYIFLIQQHEIEDSRACLSL